METKLQIAARLRYAGTICDCCAGFNHPFMLTKELWQEVAEAGENFICLLCVEKRLGRGLIIEDFNEAPINYGIFGFDCRIWQISS